jgi:FKBP-type peptidyl-prolyl cis-trans isomerase
MRIAFGFALVAMVGFGGQPAHAQDKKEGKVVTTKSGLKYEDLKEGSGEAAKSGDRVEVHYTGWLKGGMKFQSSVGGRPLAFQLGVGRVIKGWEEGIAGMKVGGKRKLFVPPELAYGKQGTADGVIPPDAQLTFEVEMLKISK